MTVVEGRMAGPDMLRTLQGVVHVSNVMTELRRWLLTRPEVLEVNSSCQMASIEFREDGWAYTLHKGDGVDLDWWLDADLWGGLRLLASVGCRHTRRLGWEVGIKAWAEDADGEDHTLYDVEVLGLESDEQTLTQLRAGADDLFAARDRLMSDLSDLAARSR
ncbi:hypothetical protein QEZ54_19140 [Catellatospora sp. KI3]|uniref:hypothetical protein n=1 Tax=Catellatospora sp. KI3 TaxID=3041620 RepID=UPI0024832121|nr:hypothetical protein [Catellatospora sp. KI3]MDI1463097.1 hypothetical protein [Catellatospora sp. KI3]